MLCYMSTHCNYQTHTHTDTHAHKAAHHAVHTDEHTFRGANRHIMSETVSDPIFVLLPDCALACERTPLILAFCCPYLPSRISSSALFSAPTICVSLCCVSLRNHPNLRVSPPCLHPQNPDIVLVHYLNVPAIEDCGKPCGPILCSINTDKKEWAKWTKEELIGQLKPMCEY